MNNDEMVVKTVWKTADEVVFAQESESLLISLANVGLTGLCC